MSGSRQRFSPQADLIQDSKGHGRIERRELWIVNTDELGGYIQKEFGWQKMRLVGKIRCSRKRTRDAQWRSQETTTWVSSLDPSCSTPQKIAAGLRHHWTIENGIFYVRDVSYGEDRSHARMIGVAISAIRNLAISIIRRAAYPYMTDAWIDISNLPDLGFSLLLK
jgi:predicted transposase YbfD/YdcC